MPFFYASNLGFIARVWTFPSEGRSLFKSLPGAKCRCELFNRVQFADRRCDERTAGYKQQKRQQCVSESNPTRCLVLYFGIVSFFMMNRLPKFFIVAVAIAAAVSILVVLITPAPDELPSTAPHSLIKLFVPSANPIYLANSFLSDERVRIELVAISAVIDLLSLTCMRLC